MFQKIGVPKNPHVDVVRVEKKKDQAGPVPKQHQSAWQTNRAELAGHLGWEANLALLTDQQTWPPWPLKIPIHGKSPPKGF
jgi:hypothetical protein